MSKLRSVLVVLLALLFFGHQPAAQGSLTPTVALFERYLGALREQAGIPGLAAAIVQNGRVVWSRGFGMANVSTSTPVTEATPFFVADLSQTMATWLVLRDCIVTGEADLDDAIQRWSPDFPDRSATFRSVLSHVSGGDFNFSRSRFAGLSRAIEECADRPYVAVAVAQVFDQFSMTRAAPGTSLECCNEPLRLLFPAEKLRSYAGVLQEMAVPYRLDSNRRPVASAYRVPRLDASNGLVASLSDLINFDLNLDAGVAGTRTVLNTEAWVQQPRSPMGLGWFVQTVKGKRVVWHFGDEPGATSSLMIKLPDERLTLILLANSDGLSAGLPLKNGDINVSPFAQIFFTLLG